MDLNNLKRYDVVTRTRGYESFDYLEEVKDGDYVSYEDVVDLIKALYKEKRCDVAPEGWTCTRKFGHNGPCAAIPSFNYDRL